MTLTTQNHRELFPHMRTSESPITDAGSAQFVGLTRTVTVASARTPLYIIGTFIDHGPIPEGFRDISKLISEREQSQIKKEALDRARKRLAARIEAASKPTLSTLRLRKGMSQEALAQAIGNSQSGYSRIESGKAQPAFETMQKLVEILSVSWDELASAITNTLQNG